MTHEDEILIEARENIGIVTFNRPRQRNALTPLMLTTLRSALEDWAVSGVVRAVLITGTGDKAFSSGYDIRAIPAGGQAELAEMTLRRALESVKNYPFPTIAVLNGQCYGAAFNLAVCCDFRIASKNANIAMPPAKLGIVYDPTGIAQFVNALGISPTRELFLLGRSYTAEEAMKRGYVDHLCDGPDLLADGLDLARQMAANAPIAVSGMKRILNLLEGNLSLTARQRAEAMEWVNESLASEDFKEAQRAFMEKRRPNFLGK